MLTDRDAAEQIIGYLRRTTGIRLDLSDVEPRVHDLYLFCLERGMAPIQGWQRAPTLHNPAAGPNVVA